MESVHTKSTTSRRVAVVIPNWNGEGEIGECLRSLLSQTIAAHIIVVDNGSVDQSVSIIKANFPEVELIELPKNLGFDGGVNVGIRRAITLDYDYIALFNNDAIADPAWLAGLVAVMDADEGIGITACKFTSIDGASLDSTGDIYTVWGLPYPRGRGETQLDTYDDQLWVFGASGGSSLYRRTMFDQIGIFDEDFFAYYEDIDISFRAQLVGWKVRYVPSSVAYHMISQTSGKIKGFSTYQTIKNLPWVLWKNVPGRYLWHVVPRFYLAYVLFIARALSRGLIMPTLKGIGMTTLLLPKKLVERHRIQKAKLVDDTYIWGILTHDLPPNATALRSLRTRVNTVLRRD